jgi:hypothetical protein
VARSFAMFSLGTTLKCSCASRFVAARAAYHSLKHLLAAGTGAQAGAVKLWRPAGRLAIENVSYLAPQTAYPFARLAIASASRLSWCKLPQALISGPITTIENCRTSSSCGKR